MRWFRKKDSGKTLTEWAAEGTPLTDGLLIEFIKMNPAYEFIGKTRAEIWDDMGQWAVSRLEEE